MEKYVDLHMHTTNSDGQFNPEQLLVLAKNNNVGTISITDHDDIRSVNDIKKINKKYDINFVNGVELSSITEIKGRKQWLHILGYGMDENNPELNRIMQKKREIRYNVNHQYLIDLLNNFNFINEDILIRIPCDRFIKLSRLIDKYITEKKLSIDQLETIRKYLNTIKPIYEGYEFADKEAIELILKSGGYPVLAHPYQYKLSYKEEYDLLIKLKNMGLVGLEKFHSGDTKEGMKMQDEFASMFDLEWTVGSDFHTDYDDFGNQIGLGKNNNLCKTNCSLLEKIKNKVYKV